jgi:hypothetical protein
MKCTKIVSGNDPKTLYDVVQAYIVGPLEGS